MGQDVELLLGVNIDHVATLRQARGTRYPDPVQAAIESEQAGADSITLHLREDRRHIQERDVLMLKDILQTRMNLEMAVTDDMLAFAERLQPHQLPRISEACARLQAAGSRVSLFIDADAEQIAAAAESGAPCIEIHTGHFADAGDVPQQAGELARIVEAVRQGVAAGLTVHAGHGLHYHNVKQIAAIPEIRELNIGHAIIAQAVFTGLATAVADMKRLMREARTGS